MPKQLNEWLNEFVENGADASDVTNWPEEAGGKTVVEPITVNPTTNQQIVEPEEGIDGFNKVTVNAVDNTIDNNISAENIKKDVTILGVTGELQTFEVDKVYNTYYQHYPTIEIETVLDEPLSHGDYYQYYDNRLSKKEFSTGDLYYYSYPNLSLVQGLEIDHYYKYQGDGQFESVSFNYDEGHLYTWTYYSGSYTMVDLGTYDTDYSDQVVMVDFSSTSGSTTALLDESTNKPISLDTSSENCPLRNVGDTVTVSYDGRKYEIKLIQD